MRRPLLFRRRRHDRRRRSGSTLPGHGFQQCSVVIVPDAVESWGYHQLPKGRQVVCMREVRQFGAVIVQSEERHHLLAGKEITGSIVGVTVAALPLAKRKPESDSRVWRRTGIDTLEKRLQPGDLAERDL